MRPWLHSQAIVTATGMADAGNDHGLVATTQSLTECFIIKQKSPHAHQGMRGKLENDELLYGF
jgi:hypothetical protein